MTVLRELVATFSVKFDGSGAQRGKRALKNLGRDANKTDKQVKNVSRSVMGLRGNLASLGLGITALGALTGLAKTLRLASDVKETFNVLEQSFGSEIGMVKEWGKTVGEEVGRSEFMLREFAGVIGAVTRPLLDKLGPDAEKMTAKVSTDFAKLAVDISSFFNTSEKEALVALRAGLTGETEPLKRFGIVATQENLAEFIGVKKSAIMKMKAAEKTLLRYNFIMANTTKAQGDARRTSEDYANALRSMESNLKDVITQIGLKMIPVFETMIRSVRDSAKEFSRLLKETDAVLAAFIIMGGAGVGALMLWVKGMIAAKIASVGLGAATTGLLIALSKIMLVIAFVSVMFLVLEDWFGFLEGKNSVIGIFVESLTGIKDAGPIFKKALEDMGAALFDFFNGVEEGQTNMWDEWSDTWVLGFSTILDKMKVNFISTVNSMIKYLKDKLSGTADVVIESAMTPVTSEGVVDFLNRNANDIVNSGGGAMDFLNRNADNIVNSGISLFSGGGSSIPTPSGKVVNIQVGDTNVNMSGGGASVGRRDIDELSSSLRRHKDEEARRILSGVEGAF